MTLLRRHGLIASSASQRRSAEVGTAEAIPLATTWSALAQFRPACSSMVPRPSSTTGVRSQPTTAGAPARPGARWSVRALRGRRGVSWSMGAVERAERVEVQDDSSAPQW